MQKGNADGGVLHGTVRRVGQGEQGIQPLWCKCAGVGGIDSFQQSMPGSHIRTFAHPHIRTSAHPHIRTSAHPHAAAFIAERPPLCTPTDLFASTPVVFFADSRIMRHPSNSSRPPLDQSKPTDRIPLLLPVHHGGAERAPKASGVSCEPSPGLVKRAQGMKGGWWGVVVIGV